MNTFFQNMLPFEIIMMMVGVLLALACIVAIFKMIFKGGSLSVMLPVLLVISVAMMGYPKIQGLSYGNLKIDVNTLSQQVQQNPNDTLARQKLQEKTSQLTTDSRYQKDVDGHNYVAQAYYSLGNYTQAKSTSDEIAKIKPSTINTQLIANINNKLSEQAIFNDQIRKISDLLAQYNSSPHKRILSAQIASALAATPKVTYTDDNAAKVIASALEVTGDKPAANRINKLANSPIHDNSDHPSIMIKDLSVPQVNADSADVEATTVQPVKNWSKGFHPYILKKKKMLSQKSK